MPTMNVRKWLETKSLGQTDELEQKSITLEVKASADETNVIEGYASTFGGEPDHVGDIVAQGAFAKTIMTRGNQVKMLVNHKWSDLIGKVIELKEDNYGLWFKAKISDTPRGNEIMTLVKDGVLDRISIGYRTIKSKWDHEKHTRTLEEVELYELSVVPIPANDRAVITGAKNNEPETPEEKAGRVLSKKTVAALEGAKSALQSALSEVDELLKVSDTTGDEGKGGQPPEPNTPPPADPPEPTDEEKRLATEEAERKQREVEAEEKQRRILEVLNQFNQETK